MTFSHSSSVRICSMSTSCALLPPPPRVLSHTIQALDWRAASQAPLVASPRHQHDRPHFGRLLLVDSTHKNELVDALAASHAGSVSGRV
eukprot:3896299-Rhodomonas_salina.1